MFSYSELAWQGAFSLARSAVGCFVQGLRPVSSEGSAKARSLPGRVMGSIGIMNGVGDWFYIPSGFALQNHLPLIYKGRHTGRRWYCSHRRMRGWVPGLRARVPDCLSGLPMGRQFLRQVEGRKKMSMGKSSSLPKSISKQSTVLERGENMAKLP